MTCSTSILYFQYMYEHPNHSMTDYAPLLKKAWNLSIKKNNDDTHRRLFTATIMLIVAFFVRKDTT